MPPGRGGRGGGRGGRGGGGFNPARGTISIAGIELNWDLSGLEIPRGPAERFPKAPPPQAPPPSEDDSAAVKHSLAVRDTIHEGSFYTILNDGMTTGLKRKVGEDGPTETSLFNPFTDNQTYTSKYLKVRRRIPKLDTRPYVADLFPPELRSILDHSGTTANGDTSGDRPNKKRKVLQISKGNAVTQIERYIKDEEQRTKLMEERGEDDEDADLDDEEQDDDKPDAVDEEDNWSAVSSDSEESGDDYNAEQYFDNGEDDDVDEDDPYDNTY
ncbi:hypothetical protein BU24DRAFT_422564 [Aaosphaeria arxii CBS 175.79]|uniref:DNA-directed RNA polymerase III subunit n=1 Tax=Aaosphaeria arxii CBS 175.79 TaxID=1450172 RepID=A0A6A5XTI1_9PLEO|nr:uncharacterized protein BU24DRAFT_422564 [Aaosphaeria arxii CBS 175.79]KAF2016216.1 hypothetical protein BU24DRAFT_422564 [Aaosphaeria arxii CBS 175.79]